MPAPTLGPDQTARFIDWLRDFDQRHHFNRKALEIKAHLGSSTIRRWLSGQAKTVEHESVAAVSRALGLGRQLVDHAEGTHVVPVPDTNPLNDDEDRMDTLERAIDQIRADLEELKRLLGTPPGDP